MVLLLLLLLETNFTALEKDVTGYTDTNYTLKTKLRVPFTDISVNYDLHGSDGRNTDEDGFEAIAVTLADEVYSLLYIPSNVTLTLNSGSNLVAAGLQGSSGTTKNRGVIINDGTIDCLSSSNIYSYGYIKGKGLIDLNSGASATDVCRMYDWLGGSKSSGLNSAKIFAINAFTIHNNSCTTKINAGSNYEAFWNIEFNNKLYVGFQRADNNDSFIVIVGESGLFKLESGYILKSADEGITNTNANKTNLASYTGSNQFKGQRDVVRIFGKCIDNSISITIAASGTSFDMVTNTELALPIAYMKISTEKDEEGNTGNLTFGAASYKFLPGTSLTVFKDTTVTINSKVNCLFYDMNSCILDEANRGSAFITSTGGHCIDRLDSYIKVDGQLIVQEGAYIGGKILTSSLNSTALISGSTTLSLKYPTAYEEQLFGLVTTCKTNTRTHTAKMNMYNGSTIEESLSTIAPGDYYSIEAKGNFGWRTNKLYLYYDLNGGSLKQGDTLETESDQKNVEGNGYVISSNDIPSIVPEKEHYTFTGWYLDINGNEIALNSVVYSSVYIFAGWEPINYNINYQYVYDNCIDEGVENIINGNPTKFNVEQTINLKSPQSTNNYVFAGWYEDKELSTPINRIYGSSYEGDITIYGLWYPEGTKTYKISYVDNNDKFDDLEDDLVVSTNINSYIVPVLDDYDNDLKYDRYFDGWYIDENFITPFDKNNISFRFNYLCKMELQSLCKYVLLFIINNSTNKA